jgi:thymidylate kinase
MSRVIIKPKIIISEGAQGAGKTTLTNLFRDQIPYSNLMRLSGIKDSSLSGRTKMVTIYYSLMQMLKGTRECGMNYIFDRTFFSERMYGMLGYKSYTFEEDYNYFLRNLAELSEHFDIYLFVLTATEETFKERLNRDKPQFASVVFSADNSLRQQEAYLQLLKEVRVNYPKQIVAEAIPTDGRESVDIAYDLIQAYKLR